MTLCNQVRSEHSRPLQMSSFDPGYDSQAILQIKGSLLRSGKPTWTNNHPSYSRSVGASGRKRLCNLGNKLEHFSVLSALVVWVYSGGLASDPEGHVHMIVRHISPSASATGLSFKILSPYISLGLPAALWLHFCSLSLSVVFIFLRFQWHENKIEL